ncbi:MAG: hypothetical protein WCD80_07495 [Desulfobaccales bacterium]
MRIPVALLLLAVIGCGQTPPPQSQKPQPLSLREAKEQLAWEKNLYNKMWRTPTTIDGVQVPFAKLKADQDRESAVFILMGSPGKPLSPGEKLVLQKRIEEKLIGLKIYIAQYELVLQLSETPEQFKQYRQECQQRLQEWHQWEAEQTNLDIQKMQDTPQVGQQ